jgi:hypothetical protein
MKQLASARVLVGVLIAAACMPAGPSRAAAGSLTIRAPSPGTEVASGEPVTVVLHSTVLGLEQFVVVGWHCAARGSGPPFEIDLDVPVESYGPFEIQGLGKTKEGEFVLTEPVLLRAVPSARLSAVDLKPHDPVVFGSRSQRLYVIGSFDDRVEREIPTDECRFGSGDAAVAAVSDGGEVRGVSNGTAWVTAECHGLKDSVEVVVVDDPDATAE